MARRFQEITEVYRQEIAALARADRWAAFLRSACRNYKLPFEEQVLVHAQRPDATAVLEIERWNRQFGRWVNKGATGIAVFDRDYPGRTRLKYYFDISDTHESRLSRPVPLWQVPTEQEPDVIEALENRFGALDDKGTLEEAIVSAMENAAADNMTDYLDDLQNCRDNSLLEELDELNLSVLYRRLLENSTAYMLMCRCGLEPDEYFDPEDFSEVFNFNTPETLNALGVATRDIAESGLSAIALTVRSRQKQIRTIAQAPGNEYPMGDRYGRVLFLKDYAAYLRDDILSELSGIDRPMILSIDVVPIPMDEAIRDGESRLLGVERNIVDFLRKQQQNNNFSGTIPYDMEKQRAEMKEFLDDLTSRDQRMLLGMVTLVHTADSKQQLDADTDYILASATQRMCQMATLRFQQMDGLNTALPIGVRKIDILRTFTSEALAALMPFRVQEIMEPGGIYYGENAISGNLLLCNRANLLNQSTIITGVPGSGKSFSAKELIVFLALATKDDILICDPEREYYALGQALGGEVIRIAAGSPDHINAMDMVEGYGDGGNPVVDKSEFILSLFEQLDRGGIGPLQKSIIDRCVDAVYAAYKRGGPVPTLRVLREKLLAQPEEEARDLALALELFTTGSLDAFAHETNVDTQNRIVIYDIMDLGRQLKTMGLLIITDAMLNRVTENWRKGKRTHLFIDEFHVVFQNPYSADFFDSAWRRFRKRGAYPTAITQNVEYLLDSVQASTMLSNSEMLILLNQAPSDREKLAALLNISPEQTGYITNAPAGCGLLRYGGALVPFKNQFPKDTELYRLMTTKPDESIIVGGNTK